MSVTIQGVTRRWLRGAARYIGGAETPARHGPYGEGYNLNLFPGLTTLVDEGSLFTVTTATPGTGLATGALSTSFSDTVAHFCIKNTETPSDSAIRIYPLRLRLILAGTAPTGTVSMHWAIKRSTISREPTTAANRTLFTPVNMNSSGDASVARFMSYSAAAAMTVPASSPEDSVVSRFTIPTGLGITGDQYVIDFAGTDLGAKPGLTAVRATDVACVVTSADPFVINPGEWAAVHMWWVTAATTAPTFEFQWLWAER